MMLWHNDVNIKLGKTFKPNGQQFWWAFLKDSDQNDPNRMFKSDVIAKIPVVHLYNEIINGAVEMPAKTLTGHVHKRVGKSLVIEFESPEPYEEKGARFGEGAVKLDVNGKFIAASFSAATKEQSAKMKVPRCIRLPDYEAEMDSAPKEEKNTTPPAGHVPIQGQSAQENNPISGDYTDEEIQKAETEMATHILTGFLKDITIALFREPRLEEESASAQKTDKWGE
jgi:hypothetical protein